MRNMKQVFPDRPRWFVSWMLGIATCALLYRAGDGVSFWHTLVIVGGCGAIVSVIEVTRSCSQDVRYEQAHPAAVDTLPDDRQTEVLWQVLDDMVGGREAAVQLVARHLALPKEARQG